MSRPVLLDLCCGAGGAARGYQQTGFLVIGVDLDPQPGYAGDDFIQGDALQLYPGLMASTGAVLSHWSPPCQGYSRMNNVHGRDYPMLIPQARALAQASGKPWIIENVKGAPLDGIMLCGQMFGLQVAWHRIFETSFPVTAPDHPLPHPEGLYTPAGHGTPNRARRHRFPHLSGPGYTARCRAAMGVDWPMPRDMLGEAIPPAYARYIGEQFLRGRR